MTRPSDDFLVGNSPNEVVNITDEGPTADGTTDDTTEVAAAVSAAKTKDLNLRDTGLVYAVDELNLVDFTSRNFEGGGMGSTSFKANGDILAGALVDIGWAASDSTHNSDVNYSQIGGFLGKSNGNSVQYGLYADKVRRGRLHNIRMQGDTASDELEHGFKYNYSWIMQFENLISAEHYGNGHEFGTSSLNSCTFTNLSATTQRTTATNYYFDGPNSIVLISPTSEGKCIKGFDFGTDVRSVTIINAHIEGDTAGFFKSGTDNNGMNVNIIGGASFGPEEVFDFTGNMQSLTISGFSMYNLDSLANLSINVSAKQVIINNLVVVEATTKTVATDEEIIAAITMSANVESCIVNGVDIAKLYRRQEFRITIDPGTPQVLESIYKTSMHRSSCRVWMSQRTSSSNVATVEVIASVPEDDTVDQTDVVRMNDGSTALTLSFDAAADMLAVDGGVAGNAKVVVEYISV